MDLVRWVVVGNVHLSLLSFSSHSSLACMSLFFAQPPTFSHNLSQMAGRDLQASAFTRPATSITSAKAGIGLSWLYLLFLSILYTRLASVFFAIVCLLPVCSLPETDPPPCAWLPSLLHPFLASCTPEPLPLRGETRKKTLDLRHAYTVIYNDRGSWKFYGGDIASLIL